MVKNKPGRGRRRLLPLLLALCVAFAMFPTAAFADDPESETSLATEPTAAPEAQWTGIDGSAGFGTLAELLLTHEQDTGIITLLRNVTYAKRASRYDLTISGKMMIRSGAGGPYTITRDPDSDPDDELFYVSVKNSGVTDPRAAELTLQDIILDGGARWDKPEGAPLTSTTENVGFSAAAPLLHINYGAVYLTGQTVIQNNDNSGITWGGGGVFLHEKSGLYLSGNAKITGNRIHGDGTYAGGGVQASFSSTVELSDYAEISNNTADQGGGMLAEGWSTVRMRGHASVWGNTASDMAGGIYIGGDESALSMEDYASVRGNTSSRIGGGVWMDNGVTMRVSDSVRIVGNHVDGKDNNLYMCQPNMIDIVRAMKPDALIGVHLPAAKETDGTVIASATTPYFILTDTDKKAFFYDGGNFGIRRNLDNTALILGEAVPAEAIEGSNMSTRTDTPLTLTAEVRPDDASSRFIEWTLKDAGATGGIVENGVFIATHPGTAIVTATIKNKDASTVSKEFTVTVTGSSSGSTPSYSGGSYSSEFYVKVTAGANGKAEEPEGFYPRDEKHTFTMVPAEGYVIDTVTLDDGSVLSHTDTQFTLLVNEPYEVHVTFKKAAGSTTAPAKPPVSKNPQTGDSWFAGLF